MTSLRLPISPLFRFFSFLLAVLWLVGAGCAHRAPQPEAPPGTTLPGTTGTNPTVPVEPGKPGETPPVTVGPRPFEKPHVALVLGGAGVASFATVGLLKRFAEEGIVIDYIITTGWPTLFALANGFMGSVHDVEWFAMRLGEKDFYKTGLFDNNKDYQAQDRLSSLIEGSFRAHDLAEAKVQVLISAANTELGEPQTYERGDWKEPLLKTMSVPGIYRPYPNKGNDTQWVQSLSGIDVDEAIRRGAKTIVAVQMYNDYFGNVGNAKRDNSDRVFRQLYLAQIKKSIKKEMKLATITSEITLGKPPGDFAAKRQAILAGYREGAKIARLVQAQPQP